MCFLVVSYAHLLMQEYFIFYFWFKFYFNSPLVASPKKLKRLIANVLFLPCVQNPSMHQIISPCWFPTLQLNVASEPTGTLVLTGDCIIDWLKFWPTPLDIECYYNNNKKKTADTKYLHSLIKRNPSNCNASTKDFILKL